MNNKNKKSASRSAAAVMVGFMLIVFFAPGSTSAMNAITVDTGYGLDDTKLLRLNFSAIDDRSLSANNGWHWNRSWEANLSYWYLYRHKEGERDLFELGVTPNFRAERDWASNWGRPYLEAGLGVHLLSKARIGTRDLGSSYQFGTHVGFGLRFGSHEQWDIAYRYEHLSNAGLKEPNPGINFGMVRFGYRW